MTTILSELVEQDHLHAETSITPPAIVTPAITNITVTSVVPPVTLHAGATSNHPFPTDVSGPQTPL